MKVVMVHFSVFQLEEEHHLNPWSSNTLYKETNLSVTHQQQQQLSAKQNNLRTKQSSNTYELLKQHFFGCPKTNDARIILPFKVSMSMEVILPLLIVFIFLALVFPSCTGHELIFTGGVCENLAEEAPSRVFFKPKTNPKRTS